MRRTGLSLAAIAAALALPVAAHAATYTVAAGAPPKTKAPASFAQGLYDSDEFYPGSKKPLKIHVGDTVKFVGGFHTASILGSGVKRSSFFLIQPGAAGSSTRRSTTAPTSRSTSAASRSSSTTPRRSPRPAART